MPQFLTLWRFFNKELIKFLSLAGALMLLGALWGQALWGFVGALVITLLLQWRAMYLLYTWLRFNSHEPPPNLRGIWASVVYTIYRLQTSERLARENLVSIVERGRASLAALDEAFVLLDHDSLAAWWNPAAERILGLQPGDQGRSILNVIRNPEFHEYFQRKPQSDTPHDGIKLASWVNENQFIQCEITRFGKNERLLIAYDITRLHHLEQVRKDFIANVSHELRTPLTVLAGYLETYLDQDDLNPRWRRGFSQMQQQTRRMTNLVNDLLMLSRLERTGANLVKQEINMPALMGQLFADAEAYNADYGHQLHLDIDSLSHLIGSEQEIASAFGNLITNAIKYTPKHGSINLRWWTDEQGGYFSVTDSGIGIEQSHIPRLTERFYRVDSGRSRESGGTGLGLAIVKHVLLQHDAYLSITSTVGKGSTFTAVFPSERIL